MIGNDAMLMDDGDVMSEALINSPRPENVKSRSDVSEDMVSGCPSTLSAIDIASIDVARPPLQELPPWLTLAHRGVDARKEIWGS